MLSPESSFADADGEKALLICAESGIFVQKGDADLVPCVTAVQPKRCCVIDEMRTALVLVGKVISFCVCRRFTLT